MIQSKLSRCLVVAVASALAAGCATSETTARSPTPPAYLRLAATSPARFYAPAMDLPERSHDRRLSRPAHPDEIHLRAHAAHAPRA
jgi:hypothetical protein